MRQSRVRKVESRAPMRVNLRTSSAFLLLLAAGLTTGACTCGKSTGAKTQALAELLPANADTVVMLPDLAVLGLKLAQVQKLKLAGFVAQLQGFSTGEEAVNALVANAGVDFRSSESMKEAGLAPERGLGVARFADGSGYAVVGVSSEEKLLKLLQNLARTRLGATQKSTHAENGLTVVTFARPGEAVGEIAAVVVGKYGLLATKVSAAALRRYATLTLPESVAGSGVLSSALKRLPPNPDVYVQQPQGGPLGADLKPLTVAVQLTREGLVVTADLPGATGAGMDVLKPEPGPQLLPLLPGDAVLLARSGSDLRRLAPYWRSMMRPSVTAMFERAGLDVEQDLLGNLKPGAVMGVSLAPTVSLASGVPTSLDMRRTNPLGWIHLVGIGEVRDASRLKPLLGKLEAAGPKLGMTLTPSERKGHDVLLSTYSQGEGASFAAVKDRVVIAAPVRRLEDALERLDGKGTASTLEPALKEALTANGVAVVVDLVKLSTAVRKLPSEAWGVGGFAMKATATRWLEATDDLKALVVTARSTPESLQAQLTLRLVLP